MFKQPVPEGLHPVGTTHPGAVREELLPMGRSHVKGVCGELCHVGGTSRWSRGRVCGVLPVRRKEQQSQHVMN